MLREWQTVNQAGLSPHDVHCHQYLAISRYDVTPVFVPGDMRVGLVVGA